jgi:hypothetical protein
MAFQEDFGKCNQCESLDCECESVITYRLLDKNSNRFMRDKEHAKFMIMEDGKELGYLWMSSTLKKTPRIIQHKKTCCSLV